MTIVLKNWTLKFYIIIIVVQVHCANIVVAKHVLFFICNTRYDSQSWLNKLLCFVIYFNVYSLIMLKISTR